LKELQEKSEKYNDIEQKYEAALARIETLRTKAAVDFTEYSLRLKAEEVDV